MSRKPEIQPKPRRALSHKLRTSENGPGIQWVDGNEGAQPNDPQRSGLISTSRSFTLTLSPHGELRLDEADGGPALSAAFAAQINDAFVRGAGVENLGSPVAGQRLLQSLHAATDVHGVRYPPGQNLAGCPVRDRYQVEQPPPMGKYVMSVHQTWLGRTIASWRSR